MSTLISSPLVFLCMPQDYRNSVRDTNDKLRNQRCKLENVFLTNILSADNDLNKCPELFTFFVIISRILELFLNFYVVRKIIRMTI